jgi:hypothetical protein
MKNKFKFSLRYELVMTVVALALADTNSFALTSAAPTNLTTSATSALAPAGSMTAPIIAKAAPITAPSAITEDIRDIRGPKHIPSPWRWPLWLAAGVAFAGLLYAAWFWNRRHSVTAALLPYEIALARLEAARALMQTENAREFSITVSEIVRHYIEERFPVRAERRTTEEFLHDLLEPSDTLLSSHRALLGDFLCHCDLAKFARWILSLDEMEIMLASAHTFVLQTGRSPAAATSSPVAEPASERAPAAPQPVPANL